MRWAMKVFTPCRENSMPNQFETEGLRRVVFGQGSAAKLAAEVELVGGGPVLVVIDPMVREGRGGPGRPGRPGKGRRRILHLQRDNPRARALRGGRGRRAGPQAKGQGGGRHRRGQRPGSGQGGGGAHNQPGPVHRLHRPQLGEATGACP